MEIKMAANERLLHRLLNNMPVICEATTVKLTVPTSLLKTVPDNINTAHGIFEDSNKNSNVNCNKNSSDAPQELVYLVNSITKEILNTNPHITLKLGKFKKKTTSKTFFILQ